MFTSRLPTYGPVWVSWPRSKGKYTGFWLRNHRNKYSILSKSLVTAALILLTILLSGCGGPIDENGLKGKVKIDGSSTVFPITEAVSEEFQLEHPGVRVTVGLSGTGGGFKKFTSGETDINNASRPMKEEEVEQAEENGIEFIELTVAFDGLSVAVNKDNDFAKNMTSAELKKVWNRGSKIKTWKDIRRGWPNRKIKLFGPGTDSGTFDYFTEVINGKEDVSRNDYTASEDDNTLVLGIMNERDAMGYFGYAYYSENKENLNVISVNGVKPDNETIRSGEYEPLSRPLFIYVNKESLEREELRAFVDFYLENAAFLSEQVGYVALDKEDYVEEVNKLEGLGGD